VLTHSEADFAYSCSMSWPQTAMPAATTDSGAEPYLPVEEVARRLDLPLGILLRRVEAGDVPSRREDRPDGVHYLVRLGDLGIESGPVQPSAPSPPAAAASRNGQSRDQGPSVDVVGTAQQPNGQQAAAQPAVAAQVQAPASAPAPAPAPPAQLPTSWPDKVVPPPDEELKAEAQSVQGRGGALIDIGSNEPRRDVASMTSLDPRELVAGLLDRWERTLEQRIYSEQRQRFEAELNSRQNLVKQLQLELQTARAEHAAAQAEKDRRLADRDRRISDLEARFPDTQDVAAKRRRWFFGR
jgi:hypothetical protein